MIQIQENNNDNNNNNNDFDTEKKQTRHRFHPYERSTDKKMETKELNPIEKIIDIEGDDDDVQDQKIPLVSPPVTKIIQVTRNAEILASQLKVQHPSKNEHVFLIKTEDSMLVSMFSFYLGTNCGLYYAIQEDYNKRDIQMIGGKAKKEKNEWWCKACVEDSDIESVTEWAEIFLSKGYVGVFVYEEKNDDGDGGKKIYQYDPEITKENKYDYKRPRFHDLIKDCKIQYEYR